MAKNWEVKEDGSMTRRYLVKKIDGDKEVWVEAEKPLTFFLYDLFPTYMEMEPVQQSCICNGMKQKLDDAVARSRDMALTEKEKQQEQASLLEQIISRREWNSASKKAEKAPSVGLKLVVPVLLKLGLSVEQISQQLGKSQEAVQRFVETGEEN